MSTDRFAVRKALAFLTPFGGASVPDARTLRWFPIVGAGIGALVGLTWWGASQVWASPLLPAALAVVADLVATGLLHIDGLADTADGLLPHLPARRRLEVMAQPDVGAFGVAVAVVVLLARFAAFASVHAHTADVAVVAGLWCASRSVMVLGTVWLPYARTEGGLASAFLGGGQVVSGVVGGAGVAAGAALAGWGTGWSGIAGIAGLIGAGAAVYALARARINGFTGDVLGAAGVLGETVALVIVVAKW